MTVDLPESSVDENIKLQGSKVAEKLVALGAAGPNETLQAVALGLGKATSEDLQSKLTGIGLSKEKLAALGVGLQPKISDELLGKISGLTSSVGAALADTGIWHEPRCDVPSFRYWPVRSGCSSA